MPTMTVLHPPTHARTLLEAATVTAHARATGTATLDAAGELVGRLIPWDTPAEVSDDGRRRYRETFAPGGLSADGVVPVFAGHHMTAGRVERGPLVGRVDDLESRADGLYGRVVLADVPAAAELRALAHTVGATFSVEFDDPAQAVDGEITRTAARLTGLAVLTAPHRGAYPGADVLAVRARPDPDEDDEDDGEDTDEDEGEVDPDALPVTDPGPASARARIEREVRRALGTVARPRPHPLARYTNAFDFYEAARGSSSDELPHHFRDAYVAYRRARAFVDQITTDNPGVVPPAWLSEIFGILDMGRPVIDAIGTRPLPPSGMEVDWPYFDGDLHALVGQQATEKSDIVSVKVSFKKASVPIKTYAGGSDISWQLIRRSQPAYRDAYLRILNIAYGVVTDNAVGDVLP
ncbi:MAG TPA: hypothetical protein VJM49_13675, partial [Acidimicrobiales bacterium]|nr:hypothetical protein [Acidimicrobiales bacterium]